MSRGLGKIELAIATAFIKNPVAAFTLDDLVRVAFPRVASIAKKHKVATTRAADKVAFGTGWRGFRTTANPPSVCFANLLSKTSISKCFEFFGLDESVEAISAHLAEARAERTKSIDIPGRWAPTAAEAYDRGKNVSKLYQEALADPEKARYLISKMPPTPEGGKLRALTGLLRRGLILGPQMTPANTEKR